jgi:hypothetical protein
VSDDDEITRLVHSRIDDLETAITAWGKLDCAVAEAGLFPLTSSSATSTPGRGERAGRLAPGHPR